MIPHNKVIEVIDAVKIEDVIGKHVDLKKRGTNYIGCCPFHNEKTPSFTVSPVKGIYKCFGCGEGGTAVNFVMKNENKSFPEAIKLLAEMYNIEITEVEQSEEEKREQNKREQLFAFNQFAHKYFVEQLETNEKAKSYVVERWGEEAISNFGLGFAIAEWDGLAKAARAAGYLEDFIKTTGLIRQNEKTNHLQDFFMNRIIFPIYNTTGRIVGFTGRLMPEKDAKGKEMKSPYPKFLNSEDSVIYSKKKSLFGVQIARKEMAKRGRAVLVEGNGDLIKLHQLGLTETVAPCGTALTNDQILLIKKFTDTVTLIYDGDKAGKKAAVKNGELLISVGMKVNIAVLPDGEDPDSFFKNKEAMNLWLKNNIVDFVLYRAEMLFKGVQDDPVLKHAGIERISHLLKNVDKIRKEIYVDTISKKYKVKAKLVNEQLTNVQIAEESEEKKPTLPGEVDPEEYERWGFYAYKNKYFFRNRDGRPVQGSNFILKPLFHIEGEDPKRIYELVNFKGVKIVVDMDMQEMTSLQAFRRNVEGRGNFLFSGSETNMMSLKGRLYEETRTASEVVNLGWQKEGFWAWANGITTEEGFVEADEYGIVEFNQRHYYIPAFSNIHIHDKSVFIEERKFRFVNRQEISLKQWCETFVKVYGSNAKIGIAFWIATIFRDHVLHNFHNFPILNLFGVKGAGKSQMALSMSCLFGKRQVPFNIHNGTKPGLAEHMQIFSNALAIIDEYKNNLEYDKIETLKSIYDAIGRSRMNMNNGKGRKETTKVNAAAILCGQEMPTADVALLSRVIFLQFHKTEYTQEEKKNFDVLKEMENDGLSHLTNQILKFRKEFEEHFTFNYEKTLKEFGEYFEKKPVEDRLLRSMCTVVASFRTVEKYLDFSFDYNDLKAHALKAVEVHNKQIAQSNEIGIFWEIVESLTGEEDVIAGWHYKIQHKESFILTDGNRKQFNGAVDLLFVRMNDVIQAYMKHCRKIGQKPLPSDSLKYYLTNQKGFVGVAKKMSFQKKVFEPDEGWKGVKKDTSAFVFEYEKLGINLETAPVMAAEKKEKSQPSDGTVEVNEDKGIPF